MKILGHTISTSIQEVTAGCPLSGLDLPQFGELIWMPGGKEDRIYAVIYDIKVPEDDLVRVIARGKGIQENVLADNRHNRAITADILAVIVGHTRRGKNLHRLPSRPPSILEPVFSCDPQDVVRFTSVNGMAYLGLLAQRSNVPRFDLLVSHLELVDEAHQVMGNSDWGSQARRILNKLLRNEPDLMIRLLQE